MKKVLLSVIFAAIGLMTTTNVMAATVAPSVKGAATIYDESLKLLSKSVFIVEIDADGNPVEETGQTAEMESFITIENETVTIKMGKEEYEDLISFKVINSYEPKEDAEGTKSMVMSCLDEDGEKVKVVLMNKANGDIAVTVHSKGMGLAFMNISIVETLLAANCEALNNCKS